VLSLVVHSSLGSNTVELTDGALVIFDDSQLLTSNYYIFIISNDLSFHLSVKVEISNCMLPFLAARYKKRDNPNP